MEKEVMCPWCNKNVIPQVKSLKRDNGEVRERRCGSCGKVLAAYLAEEGDFMGNIRKFQN